MSIAYSINTQGKRIGG